MTGLIAGRWPSAGNCASSRPTTRSSASCTTLPGGTLASGSSGTSTTDPGVPSRPDHPEAAMPASSRRALVVRGGWEGHCPVEATDQFIPFLKEQGFSVDVHDSPAAYDDAEALLATDLVLQCYTQGAATD